MCVIAYGQAGKILPHIKKMMEMNPHGVGVAWTNHEETFYIKGISSEGDAIKKVESLDGADIVFHARIATHGGRSLLLTHPFPINDSVDLNFTGSAKSLLFHNGIWRHCRDFEDAVPNKTGPWSDTRIMSFMLGNGYFSREVLPFCGGSWLVFYPTEAPFMAGQWEKDDGVYYSNLLWKAVHKPYTQSIVYGQKATTYDPKVWNYKYERSELDGRWKRLLEEDDKGTVAINDYLFDVYNGKIT